MSVSFTCLNNVNLSCRLRNPELDNSYKLEQKITYGRSAAGQLYRYNKGITIKNVKLDWIDLINQEKISLENIFLAIGAGDFIYTDHNGTAWNAHFTTPALEFAEIYDEKENADGFCIDGIMLNSTMRKNPRWSVSLEMEIWL